MRFVLSVGCCALFAAAFLLGCGGDRGQSASTTNPPARPTPLGTAVAPNVDGAAPATSAANGEHQPPPRTPEN